MDRKKLFLYLFIFFNLRFLLQKQNICSPQLNVIINNKNKCLLKHYLTQNVIKAQFKFHEFVNYINLKLIHIAFLSTIYITIIIFEIFFLVLWGFETTAVNMKTWDTHTHTQKVQCLHYTVQNHMFETISLHFMDHWVQWKQRLILFWSQSVRENMTGKRFWPELSRCHVFFYRHLLSKNNHLYTCAAGDKNTLTFTRVEQVGQLTSISKQANTVLSHIKHPKSINTHKVLGIKCCSASYSADVLQLIWLSHIPTFQAPF